MPKPEAVILDVDGTLMDVRPVIHHVIGAQRDVDAFVAGTEFCPTMPEAIEFCVKHHERGRVIVVVSARDPRWFSLTVNQLDRFLPCPYEGPYIKDNGDTRHDVIFKLDIFLMLRERYDIVAAIDDHPGVVDLFTDLGVPEVIETSFTTYDESHRNHALMCRKASGLLDLSHLRR